MGWYFGVSYTFQLSGGSWPSGYYMTYLNIMEAPGVPKAATPVQSMDIYFYPYQPPLAGGLEPYRSL